MVAKIATFNYKPVMVHVITQQYVRQKLYPYAICTKFVNIYCCLSSRIAEMTNSLCVCNLFNQRLH